MDKVFKISNMLDETKIIDIQSNDKKKALNELLEVICKDDKITNEKTFKKEIFKREKLMSTGIGYGIAIPHARHRSVKDFVMAIGRKKEGLEYGSIDDKPVKLIFMIGASDTQDKDYIKVLSRLVLRLKNQDFVDKMLSVEDPSVIYEIIKQQK